MFGPFNKDYNEYFMLCREGLMDVGPSSIESHEGETCIESQ